MNCHHCAEPLSVEAVATHEANDGHGGRVAHLCADHHLADRFGPRVAEAAAKGKMTLATFACGCTMDFPGDPHHYLALFNHNQLRWECRFHGSPLISIEPYTPNYPCDLPADFWDADIEQALMGMARILEDTRG